jgi:hypothetical protein
MVMTCGGYNDGIDIRVFIGIQPVYKFFHSVFDLQYIYIAYGNARNARKK